MHVSEARVEANRKNASLSSGPRTAEGKEKSRRNAYKHGLAGDGVVLAVDEAAEVDRRNEALLREMAPKSEMGTLLILQMATTSVRLERAARREFAAVAERVRHAPDDFDEARVDRAEALFESLPTNPRGNLRRLKKSLEGITLLVDAWRNLRFDLTRPNQPVWTPEHLVKAANLLGIREADAKRSRLGVLSDAIMGDFAGLADTEGGNLDEPRRRAWARAATVAMIDRAFDELEEHAGTIDLEILEIDRAEAGERALFDASKDASLARRYESDASRRFYKALKEFREVEAEAASRPESPPTPPTMPRPDPLMGSFRESPPPTVREPVEIAPEAPRFENPALQDRDGQPIRPVPTAQPPG